MPTYKYKAITMEGAPVSGTVDANSLDEAANSLSVQGYIPQSLKKSSGSGDGKGFFASLKLGKKKVLITELVLFTKQFRTMYQAGLPILSLLQVLERQTQSLALKEVISSMIVDVKGGSSLHDSLTKYPEVFSNLYCSMVQAGEASGSMVEVLERLAGMIEHEYKIKQNIKSALQYPKMVVGALFIAFFILLTVVVPKFVKVFESAKLELPVPTKICVWMYDALNNYWYVIIAIVVAAIFFWKSYMKTEQGILKRDELFLKIPVIGDLMIKAAMSRFGNMFALLQSSGVPILEIVRILSGTIGNAAIAHEFDKLKSKLEQGHGISGPLSTAKYFTPMVVDMVAIGEESGSLEVMLTEVSKHYDDEVNYAISGLSEALNPTLIVGLTGVVGFFALAIFLPMWDLTKMAH